MIFPLAPVSRPTLRHTQPPIQWVPGVLSQVKAWPGRDANHSSPATAKVKNKLYTPLPLGTYMAVARQFYFYFLRVSLGGAWEDDKREQNFRWHAWREDTVSCRWEDNIKMDFNAIRLMWTGMLWLGQDRGRRKGACQHDNEPSDSMKDEQFLD
jgi:hypothetical protein